MTRITEYLEFLEYSTQIFEKFVHSHHVCPLGIRDKNIQLLIQKCQVVRCANNYKTLGQKVK
jgi:hypothetical protein